MKNFLEVKVVFFNLREKDFNYFFTKCILRGSKIDIMYFVDVLLKLIKHFSYT